MTIRDNLLGDVEEACHRSELCNQLLQKSTSSSYSKFFKLSVSQIKGGKQRTSFYSNRCLDRLGNNSDGESEEHSIF